MFTNSNSIFFRRVFFFFLGLIFSFSVFAQVQTARYIKTGPKSNAFYEYLPQGYNQYGAEKYPVLIFLHGLGENGDGSPGQLPNVLRNGPPMLCNQGKFPVSFTVNNNTYKFVVISPQFSSWPGAGDVSSVIDYVAGNYNIDISRIYLTGLSQGGGVTWDYSSSDVASANRLAAIVTVCGAMWIDDGRANNIATAKLPVWATHNSADPTVGADQTISNVDKINAAANMSPALAKKTIFNTYGHDAWSVSYDPGFKEDGMNIYEWMLQYTNNRNQQNIGNPPAGNGLSASYYNSMNLSGVPVLSRTDATVNFNWQTGSPASQVTADKFSVRWTGQVKPGQTGAYTFYVNSDDGTRLYVNNQLIIDQWVDKAASDASGTIYLSANTLYDIKLEYYDNQAGASCAMSWSTPGINKQVIPSQNLFASSASPATGNGLSASYYNNIDFSGTPVLSRTDAAVNFNWQSGSPASQVTADKFSIRWTGQVKADQTGAYTFYVNSDDGARLYVNNQLIIDQWVDKAASDVSGKITLVANTLYDIKLEYYDNQYDASCAMSWSAPGISKQVIPSQNLFTSSTNPATNNGLSASYYNNINFSGTPALSRTDATVNFNWQSGSPGSPINTDKFSVRWTGQVKPDQTGAYTFYVNSDDGTRLYVNNQLIIDQWVDKTASDVSGTIYLSGNTLYDIRLEYYENQANASCAMSWSAPGINKQIIPNQNLFTSGSAVPSNQAPVANAGIDQTITLPANSVILNGSGTDADGNVVSYSWAKISGPDTYTLVSPGSGQTAISNLGAGNYVFRLTVADDKGATGLDDVNVKVNQQVNNVSQRILINAATGSEIINGTDRWGKYWNNMTNAAGGIEINNAITTTNAATSIKLEVINRIDGTFNVSDAGVNNINTGVEVGDYPAEAVKGYAFSHSSTSSGQWKISGLDPGLYYTIKFWGNKAATDSRIISISKPGEAHQYDASFNTNFNNAAVFTISGVSEQVFDIKTQSGTFGYINVVDINANSMPPSQAAPTVLAPANLQGHVDDNVPAGLSVYPNPVKNAVTLRLKNGITGEGEIKVYDMLGRLHNQYSIDKQIENFTKQIDFSDKIHGIYIIKLSIGNKTEMIKVVKE